MRQLSFSDYEWSVNRNKKTRSEIQLDKINNIVDWQKVKMLFVQYLYNLSDPELEDQLCDRLSFQHFVELNFSQHIPDFTTFWRFK